MSNTVALEIWLIRIPNFIGGKYFFNQKFTNCFFQFLKSIFACHESGWFINFIIWLGKSIFDPTQMKIFKLSSFNQSKHAKKICWLTWSLLIYISFKTPLRLLIGWQQFWPCSNESFQIISYLPSIRLSMPESGSLWLTHFLLRHG